MPTAVVDSNILIASRDEDDERHDASRAIVSGIDHGVLPEGYVTDYVVAEVLNLLHSRWDHELAIDTYERLERGTNFRLVRVTEGDFERAIRLFYTYSGLSFVDAALVAYMERTNVEFIYSFDSDFDALDSITRLRTDVNPFVP